jgi:hypothetical protein
MDALTAILTCSLYLDDALVLGIVDNAHDDPLFLVEPDAEPEAGAAAEAAPTRAQAARRVREAVAHGERVLVGAMQVPAGWAARFGRPPEDLLDPCVNVSIGTAMLSEYDQACRQAAGLASRRACVLGRYALALGVPELTTVVTLALRYAHTRWTAPEEAPLFAPGPEGRAWGADCLLAPGFEERPESGL